jgi:hypothetical protein
MANARKGFEVGLGGQAAPARRTEKGMWQLNTNGGDGGVRQVQEPDQMPRTLVIVLHEEAINQFLGMAYYGGVISRGEVSVRAMEFRTPL